MLPVGGSGGMWFVFINMYINFEIANSKLFWKLTSLDAFCVAAAQNINLTEAAGFFQKITSKIIVRQHRAWTTEKVSETKTWQTSLVSDSVWRELQKAADTKTWLFMKNTWEEGAEMGDQGGLSLPGKLFCLYYIPSVSCYSLVPALAQRGLTKKKEAKRGRGPGGNTRSQKIYFTPVQKPVFQARTMDWVKKEMKQDRQGQVGGGGRGWGLMTVRRNI